jgi:hypothetical protein
MDAADRRFTWILLVVFGPLFVFGGFLAAFTVPGAVFVFLGLGMLLSGLAMAVRVPLLWAAAAGVALFVLLTVQMALDLSR